MAKSNINKLSNAIDFLGHLIDRMGTETNEGILEEASRLASKLEVVAFRRPTKPTDCLLSSQLADPSSSSYSFYCNLCRLYFNNLLEWNRHLILSTHVSLSNHSKVRFFQCSLCKLCVCALLTDLPYFICDENHVKYHAKLLEQSDLTLKNQSIPEKSVPKEGDQKNTFTVLSGDKMPDEGNVRISLRNESGSSNSNEPVLNESLRAMKSSVKTLKNTNVQSLSSDVLKVLKSYSIIVIETNELIPYGTVAQVMEGSCTSEPSLVSWLHLHLPEPCTFWCRFCSQVKINNLKDFMEHLMSCVHQNMTLKVDDLICLTVCLECKVTFVSNRREVSDNHDAHLAGYLKNNLSKFDETPVSDYLKPKESDKIPLGSNIGCDVDTISGEVIETDVVTIEKQVETMLIYLIDRYIKEPFCAICGTVYFCDLCTYHTSYHKYWKSHLKSKGHNNACSIIKNAFLFHCHVCGMKVCLDEKKKDFLQTSSHENIDSIFSSLKRTDFSLYIPNCDASHHCSPKIKFSNELNSTVLHSGACLVCPKRMMASNLAFNNYMPFIVLNKSLPRLDRRLHNFLLNYKNELLDRSVHFCCLDCDNNTLEPYESYSDHLYDEFHSSLQANVSFGRTTFFCMICCTVFVAGSIEALNKIPECALFKKAHVGLVEVVKSTWKQSVHVDQIETLFSAIEKMLKTCDLKVFYFNNKLVLFCHFCNGRFHSLKGMQNHFVSGKHIQSLSTILNDLILCLCHSCGRIGFTSNTLQNKFCRHITQVISSFQLGKTSDSNYRSHWRYQNVLLKSPLIVSTALSMSPQLQPSIQCASVFTSSFENYNLLVVSSLTRNKTVKSITSNDHVFSVYSSCDYLRNSDKFKKISPDFNFCCQVCCEHFLCQEEFFVHLRSICHLYNCRSFGSDDPVPFLTVCDPCKKVFVFGDTHDLNEHYSSFEHLAKQLPQYDINLPLTDFKIWEVSELSDECKSMFSSLDSLKRHIKECEEDMKEAQSYYNKWKLQVGRDISSAIASLVPKHKVYFFGSRETGLAKDESDIDVFVCLDDFYFESCPDASHFIYLFAKAFRGRAFHVREAVLKARVPLLRLYYRPRSFLIDLNCLDAAGVENTKLMSFYLNFDKRVRTLVVAVREWASVNGLRGGKAINSYSFLLLVLFFLMQPHIHLVPTVSFLHSLCTHPPRVIKGYDCSFCNNQAEVRFAHEQKNGMCSLTIRKLLVGFFEFYSHLEMSGKFISVRTGCLEPRRLLGGPPNPAQDKVNSCVEGTSLAASTSSADSSRPTSPTDPTSPNFPASPTHLASPARPVTQVHPASPVPPATDAHPASPAHPATHAHPVSPVYLDTSLPPTSSSPLPTHSPQTDYSLPILKISQVSPISVLGTSLIYQDSAAKEHCNVLGLLPLATLNTALKPTDNYILLDPFLSNFNVLRNVQPPLWDHFMALCCKTLLFDCWMKS